MRWEENWESKEAQDTGLAHSGLQDFTTGWGLKQERYTFSRPWRLESEVKDVGRVDSFEAPVLAY